MSKYDVTYKVDASGAVIDRAPVALETDDFGAALAEADRLTAAGSCGQIRRDDGAYYDHLGGGGWIDANGEEVAA